MNEIESLERLDLNIRLSRKILDFLDSYGRIEKDVLVVGIHEVKQDNNVNMSRDTISSIIDLLFEEGYINYIGEGDKLLVQLSDSAESFLNNKQ